MRDQATLSRRTFAAAIPLALAAPVAFPALSGANAAPGLIDTAASRCRAAKVALDAALDAYERALPAPHFTLDMTERRPFPFGATVERRLLDGKAPNRVIDFRGRPGLRYVATVEMVEQDIRRCPAEDRDRRRLLYRMRRRAKARAAKIEALEASFCLEELQREVDAANRVLEQLTQELFAEPATSMAAVLIQAKALSAYADAINEQYATFQAGRYGAQLAADLQTVARAA